MSTNIHKTRTDLQTIFSYLKYHVATNTMVSKATGIPQKSITRYKRDLELKGLLFETVKKPCKVTNRMCWWITTNPEYANKIKPAHGNGRKINK